MSDLPEPLTPAEADLQDFPFMPLHVARLRDSDLAAEEEPETCWYAVLLWGAAWHQLPAGSLPDNDTVLMRLVGLGRDLKTWKKHRAGALRGFVKCSDGRLYHPVVAEQVADAWESKLRQRHRTYCAAVRKHNSRHDTDQRDTPDFETWLSQGQPAQVTRENADVTRDTPQLSRVTGGKNECDIASKGQGQGQGQGIKEEESPLPPHSDKGSAPEPEPPPVADYAFDGRTVRLNRADFDGWARAYHAIPDLAAELTAIDAWWQKQPAEKRKDWFVPTSGMLNRKHQDALRTAPKGSGEPVDFSDVLTQRRREREQWERSNADDGGSLGAVEAARS